MKMIFAVGQKGGKMSDWIRKQWHHNGMKRHTGIAESDAAKGQEVTVDAWDEWTEDVYICPFCKYMCHEAEPKYCPNCGSDLRGENRMSEKRVCCNCRRNIRREENGMINCYCEIDGHYIGYIECMTGWCRRWASDAKKWRERDNDQTFIAVLQKGGKND